MIDLLSIQPQRSPDELVQQLSPGPRFSNVRFETYQPNSEYPSQEQAHSNLLYFLGELLGGSDGKSGESGQSSKSSKSSRLQFFKNFKNLKPSKKSAPTGQGFYLDGGFGVGKTHLLSSAFFYATERSHQVAFMSFQELMYLIGAMGMTRAVQTFRGHRLLLIDEFELDDPGNTHMANTFLGQLMPTGTHVIATSNTEPGALGEGRFNAEDFQRQIQGIASRFSQHRIDGPDYRQRSHKPTAPLSDHEYTDWIVSQEQSSTAVISHRELNRHLMVVHPSQFSVLLEDVQAIAIEHLTPMTEQAIALRFVHFIDKLYDLGLKAVFTGTTLNSLFDESYRHGGYAKKYSRCLSRISEMLQEVRTDL